jgi:ribosome-binding protein aMBF1 (putative translation factor)
MRRFSSTITSEAVRKARELLGWSRAELAVRSGISIKRVILHESRKGQLLASYRTINALQRALEQAGIEFIIGAKCDARLRSKMSKGVEE